MKSKSVQLDISDMLGFRLIAGSESIRAKVGAKAGGKAGIKISQMLGAKAGGKAGAKL